MECAWNSRDVIVEGDLIYEAVKTVGANVGFSLGYNDGYFRRTEAKVGRCFYDFDGN